MIRGMQKRRKRNEKQEKRKSIVSTKKEEGRGKKDPRIKSAPFLRSIGAQAQAEVLKHQRRLQSSLDAVNR